MSPLTPLRAVGRSARRLGRRLDDALRSRGLKLAVTLGIPYVAAIASIGSFLARGGTGQPTTLELLLLTVTLGVLFLYALGADAGA